LEHRWGHHRRSEAESVIDGGAQRQHLLRRQTDRIKRPASNQRAVVRGASGRAPDLGRDSEQRRRSSDVGEAGNVFLQAELQFDRSGNTKGSDKGPAKGPSGSVLSLNTAATGANNFERLFDALATAVVVLDAEDCVWQMNTAAEGLLGISLKRAMGKSFEELAPGLEGLSALCKRARAEQQSFGQALRIMAPQRDGTELELSARVSPANDGSSDMLLIELFDTTQRHHLDRESALVTQRGASRRMLSQLAHEIRNPLGGLRGAAQLLERELENPSLHEFTQVIIGEADRLESLVAGLLGPGSRPDMQPANLHEVLEYIARLVCSEEPQIELQRDYDPSLPDLLMDRDQLTQALLNLMRNAAQAIKGNGVVILRTRVGTNQILSNRLHRVVAVVEIEDNGPGVPEDITDTIFYPLVTGRKDGTGIGLPLAQELVTRHRGLIEFSSRPGKTVFSVSLPVLEATDVLSGEA